MAQRLTATHRRALRKEAQDWDRLSDEDLMRLLDTARPVNVRVRRPRPTVLQIALDEVLVNGLRRFARRKQLRVQELAAMWVAERLAVEHAQSRPRRMA
jgi:hypothetical protein